MRRCARRLVRRFHTVWNDSKLFINLFGVGGVMLWGIMLGFGFATCWILCTRSVAWLISGCLFFSYLQVAKQFERCRWVILNENENLCDAPREGKRETRTHSENYFFSRGITKASLVSPIYLYLSSAASFSKMTTSFVLMLGSRLCESGTDYRYIHYTWS